MATKSVDVEVDLDDFSDTEIIAEVEKRIENGGDFLDRVNDLCEEYSDGLQETEEDELMEYENMPLEKKMKLDFLRENIDKLTLQQLESLL